MIEPLEAFEPFRKLPIELREMIWKEGLPEARVIYLEKSKKHEKAIFCRARVPNLLHVNQESRQVAKKSYQLSLATASSPGHTYVNRDIDYIYSKCRVRKDCNGGVGCGHSVLKLIEKSEIKRVVWEWSTNLRYSFKMAVECCTDAEELYIHPSSVSNEVRTRTGEVEWEDLTIKKTGTTEKGINITSDIKPCFIEAHSMAHPATEVSVFHKLNTIVVLYIKE